MKQVPGLQYFPCESESQMFARAHSAYENEHDMHTIREGIVQSYKHISNYYNELCHFLGSRFLHVHPRICMTSKVQNLSLMHENPNRCHFTWPADCHVEEDVYHLSDI